MLKKLRSERYIYVTCAFIVAVSLAVCSVAQYAAACGNVRSGVLRLHIIANSDSDEDQFVKLEVRDALLESSKEIFTDDITASDAAERLEPYLGAIEAAANGILKEEGFGYSSQAKIVYEYFDTREYDGFTLPAGKYTALKIVLGEGKGKNWWCVLFPPLCVPAAREKTDVYAVFSEEGIKVVEPENGYKVRFLLIELVEKLIDSIKD